MHDLNQAGRFADQLIVMINGSIVTQGTPQTVFTAQLLNDVFNFNAVIIQDPQSNTPMSIAIHPQSTKLHSLSAVTAAASPQ